METQIKDKSQYDSIGLKEWKHRKHCKKQQKKVLQTAADTRDTNFNSHLPSKQLWTLGKPARQTRHITMHFLLTCFLSCGFTFHFSIFQRSLAASQEQNANMKCIRTVLLCINWKLFPTWSQLQIGTVEVKHMLEEARLETVNTSSTVQEQINGD